MAPSQPWAKAPPAGSRRTFPQRPATPAAPALASIQSDTSSRGRSEFEQTETWDSDTNGHVNQKDPKLKRRLRLKLTRRSFVLQRDSEDHTGQFRRALTALLKVRARLSAFTAVPATASRETLVTTRPLGRSSLCRHQFKINTKETVPWTLCICIMQTSDRRREWQSLWSIVESPVGNCVRLRVDTMDNYGSFKMGYIMSVQLLCLHINTSYKTSWNF